MKILLFLLGDNFFTHAFNEVFVIDVISDTVRLSGFMPFNPYCAGFIVANNVFYSFGSLLNQFQYLNAPSNAPTGVTEFPTYSTSTPSSPPTLAPTFAPSIDIQRIVAHINVLYITILVLGVSCVLMLCSCCVFYKLSNNIDNDREPSI
eukprot:808925_1